ncbi:tetratricopeptide repeat protein [Motilibacter rhizosphaerae]|uniref:Tetratricopeptide repeat protein n=1 Tax=Motilibacter rhizosphaerae TaxID=598652 RepID=A0A4Q7NB84_9ACTN|nr:tetratricopeptide repeat protein [Motilibacter rhizosphaerae]RZS80238.1 tetratricopeptide repeat protein [Motilibacter rhizosphaerae]
MEPSVERGDDEGRGPGGEVYDWYQRGRTLLESGSPEAAATLLEHAVDAEPGSASLREALARALFDARRYDEALVQFTTLTQQAPQEDYAWFGLGLTRYRLGQVEAAAEHLAMAVAMRPGRPAYVQALREARATLRAREELAEGGGGTVAPGAAPEGPAPAPGSAPVDGD